MCCSSVELCIYILSPFLFSHLPSLSFPQTSSVLNDHDVARTLVLRNTGSVPVGFTARVRSPFYKVQKIPSAIVKKNPQTGTYSVSGVLPPLIERRITNNNGNDLPHDINDTITASHVNSTLMPGQTMPLSIVLSASGGDGFHSYTGLLIVSTLRNHNSRNIDRDSRYSKSNSSQYINNDNVIEEQHITAPLRGQGGNVMLHHFKKLHFGIIPLNSKITRTFHLHNLGKLDRIWNIRFCIV